MENGKREAGSNDMELCKKEAEQGDAEAQYRLGRMYCQSQKLMDYVRAAVWFQRAAEQGHVDAQYELGELYFEGKGIDRDYAKAAEWFQKAADQDHTDAQFRMAYMYEEGIGVKKDVSMAGVWRGMLRYKGLLPDVY